MTLLHTLPVSRVAPVLFLPLYTRSLLDHSGLGHHATVVDSDLHWRRAGEQDGVYARGTGRLSVANTAVLEAVTDSTLFWWGHIRAPKVEGRVFAKKDAGGNQLDVYWKTTGYIIYHDGAAGGATPNFDFANLRSIAISCRSGQKGIAFANGVELGLLSVPTTITGDDSAIYIQNLATTSRPNDNPLQGLIWYPGVLHPDEIAALDAWSQERRSPLVHADRRYFDQGSLVTGREPGLAGSWDLGRSQSGSVADESVNANHGVITGAHRAKMRSGFPGLRFGNATDKVVVLDDPAIDITGACSIEVLVQIQTGGVGGIYDKGSGAQYLGSNVGNLLWGTTVGLKSTNVGSFADDQPHHIVVTYDGTPSGANGMDGLRIYVDGAEVAAYTESGTFTGFAATVVDLRLGNRYTDADTIEGLLGSVSFYNYELVAAEVAAKYKQVARKVTFSDDLSQARPSFANETSERLSNIGLTIMSGSWAVEDDSASGSKLISCKGAGIVAMPSEQAYGTWEFEVKKTPTTFLDVAFLSSLPSLSGNRFRLALTGTESIKLLRLNTTLFATVDSYVAADTWYKLCITRDVYDEFTAYIKGGVFTNWTLIDVTGGSGTNPITDASYTTSKYFFFNLDIGDEVRGWRMWHGVVPPLL